ACSSAASTASVVRRVRSASLAAVPVGASVTPLRVVVVSPHDLCASPRCPPSALCRSLQPRYRGDVTPTTPAALTQESVEAELDGIARSDLGRIVVVGRTPSTSTDLLESVRADPGAWPDRSVLVADHQQAGRGRAG